MQKFLRAKRNKTLIYTLLHEADKLQVISCDIAGCSLQDFEASIWLW